MTWGVQAFGVAYGTVPKDSGTTRKMEPNVNGDVFVALPIGGGFRFQPEVKFDHREITIGGITTKTSYLTVPLLVRNDFLGIFMTQGVGLNFLTKAEVFDVDFKDTLTSPDFSIIIGVGKTIGRVSVEGRWDIGVRTFQKDISEGGVRLRAITANISIHLN